MCITISGEAVANAEAEEWAAKAEEDAEDREVAELEEGRQRAIAAQEEELAERRADAEAPWYIDEQFRERAAVTSTAAEAAEFSDGHDDQEVGKQIHETTFVWPWSFRMLIMVGGVFTCEYCLGTVHKRAHRSHVHCSFSASPIQVR